MILVGLKFSTWEEQMDANLNTSWLKAWRSALLVKWLWCFALEPESLRRRMIVNKQGLHPFDWVEGLKAHIETLGKTYPLSLLSFDSLIVGWGNNKEMYF